MHTMHSNFAKSQALPLAIRVSLEPICFKQFHSLQSHSVSIASFPKPSLDPMHIHFTAPSHRFDHKSHKPVNSVIPTKSFVGLQFEPVKMGATTIGKASFSNGFRLRSAFVGGSMSGGRSFSYSHSQKINERSPRVEAGKSFPWLSTDKVKEAKGLKEGSSKSGRFSREQSVERLGKVGSRSSWEKSLNQSEKMKDVASGSSSWEVSAKKLEKGAVRKTIHSTWDDSAETVVGRRNGNLLGNKESRNRITSMVKNRESGNAYSERDNSDLEEAKEEKESENVDDPRWDKIKIRATRMVGVKGRTEKPENQRWNNQETWARRTWKEATESTLPKMVGEVIYGVGPVLAALSAGRRELYALYVQEGLDLSSNNRKKKDKKGFERVLRMAQKIGLSTREVSKHDLNMVADNRPHQGLVLDASPLEILRINELDPEEEKGSLWVALDEVTDPQNLGAIVRSAYFFGASGLVLCAKNSAPLSGVVSKASAGSLELMELRYCKNMMQFLVASADNGWRVLGGSVSSKAVPLNQVVAGKPTILVLGSEGTGLRPLVERSCTQLVRIPGNIPVDMTMGGANDREDEESNLECSNREFHSFLAVESLNVSVAAGVLLHHLIGNNNESHMSDEPVDAGDRATDVRGDETAQILQ